MNDPPTNIRRTQHNWSTEQSVSVTVILAVSESSNTPPDDLPPLCNSIAPDALTTLIESGSDDPEKTTSVTFEYHDHRITAHSDGWISLHSIESRDPHPTEA